MEAPARAAARSGYRAKRAAACCASRGPVERLPEASDAVQMQRSRGGARETAVSARPARNSWADRARASRHAVSALPECARASAPGCRTSTAATPYAGKVPCGHSRRPNRRSIPAAVRTRRSARTCRRSGVDVNQAPRRCDRGQFTQIVDRTRVGTAGDADDQPRMAQAPGRARLLRERLRVDPAVRWRESSECIRPGSPQCMALGSECAPLRQVATLRSARNPRSRAHTIASVGERLPTAAGLRAGGMPKRAQPSQHAFFERDQAGLLEAEPVNDEAAEHRAITPLYSPRWNEAEVASVLLAPAALGRRLQPVSSSAARAALRRATCIASMHCGARTKIALSASQQALDHLEGLLGELFTLRRIQVNGNSRETGRLCIDSFRRPFKSLSPVRRSVGTPQRVSIAHDACSVNSPRSIASSADWTHVRTRQPRRLLPHEIAGRRTSNTCTVSIISPRDHPLHSSLEPRTSGSCAVAGRLLVGFALQRPDDPAPRRHHPGQVVHRFGSLSFAPRAGRHHRSIRPERVQLHDRVSIRARGTPLVDRRDDAPVSACTSSCSDRHSRTIPASRRRRAAQSSPRAAICRPRCCQDVARIRRRRQLRASSWNGEGGRTSSGRVG